MVRISSDELNIVISNLKKDYYYRAFHDRQLCSKIKREKEAWELILKYQDNYSSENFTQILQKVDKYQYFDKESEWFGRTIDPNINNILRHSSERKRNDWMNILLFSSYDKYEALQICLSKEKIPYIGTGLATIFLYLQLYSNKKYIDTKDVLYHNIWCPIHNKALFKIGLIDNNEIASENFDYYYRKFDEAASEFQYRYNFFPQELDFVLYFIGNYVTDGSGHFYFSRNEYKRRQFDQQPINTECLERKNKNATVTTPKNEIGSNIIKKDIEKLENMKVIIDGSNIGYKENEPFFDRIFQLDDYLQRNHFREENITFIFDASYRHKVGKELFQEKKMEKNRKFNHERFIETPSGESADKHILLNFKRDFENSKKNLPLIISNDSFNHFKDYQIYSIFKSRKKGVIWVHDEPQIDLLDL